MKEKLCPALFLFLLSACAVQAQEMMPSVISAPIANKDWKAQGITPPALIESGSELYPAGGTLNQSDGICSMHYVIDVQGRPQQVKVLHCSDPAFAGDSLDNIRKERFSPALSSDGKPVAVEIDTVYRYHFANYVLWFEPVATLVVEGVPLFTMQIPGMPHRKLVLDRKISKGSWAEMLAEPVRTSFIAEKGGATTADAEGVYTLTRSVTGPHMLQFIDKGYGKNAFVHEGPSRCEFMLTIDGKGKPSGPELRHCDRPELEGLALESLMHSRYEPGFVLGHEVAMRGLVRISYGDAEASGEAAK